MTDCSNDQAFRPFCPGSLAHSISDLDLNSRTDEMASANSPVDSVDATVSVTAVVANATTATADVKEQKWIEVKT